MLHQTLKALMIIMLGTILTSQAMMISYKPNKQQGAHWSCNERITDMSFTDQQTLSVKTPCITYSCSVDTKQVTVTSAFETTSNSAPIIETERHTLTVFGNTIYIHDKKSKKIDFVTHNSKIKDVSFTPDKKNIIILSAHKITICGIDGIITFSTTHESGKLIPNEWFNKVAVSPDGSKIAFSTSKNNVYVEDISPISTNRQKPLNDSHANKSNKLIKSTPEPTVKPWYQRWWSTIKRYRYKILAASAIIGGSYALYKWKNT